MRMKILLNEKPLDVRPGETIFGLRDRLKPGSDVVVYNGHPISEDLELREGDSLQFIKKGEIPSPEEMEALITARHSPGVHQVLKRATVGIAGLGGLGSPCAWALCRMGIGKLIVADFDVVEPSNLNRQLYFIDQIGMTKTEATVANLRRINPYVEVEAHKIILDESNIPIVFKEASVVIEAFDKAEMKAMIIRTILDKMPHVTVIAGSGVAGYGDGNEITVNRMMPRLYIVGDHKSEARPGSGLMASRVGIAAHQQANTAVRIILGDEK
jgi:sulfur carrier protein ThiS adenylyltransferase